MKHVMPQYDAMHMSQADRDRANNILYNTTGGKVFSLFEQQMHTILQGVNTYKITPGMNAGSSEADKTLMGAMSNFDAAWSDFKKTFGDDMLPIATKLVQGGNWMLSHLLDSNAKMKDEQAYVNGGGSIWGRLGRMFDWTPGKGGVTAEPKRDAAVASGGGNAPHVTVQNFIDGKEISDHTVRSIVRKTSTRLGSGFYDLNASMPTQLATGH
jgi:hypothetical protein